MYFQCKTKTILPTTLSFSPRIGHFVIEHTAFRNRTSFRSSRKLLKTCWDSQVELEKSWKISSWKSFPNFSISPKVNRLDPTEFSNSVRIYRSHIIGYFERAFLSRHFFQSYKIFHSLYLFRIYIWYFQFCLLLCVSKTYARIVKLFSCPTRNPGPLVGPGPSKTRTIFAIRAWWTPFFS